MLVAIADVNLDGKPDLVVANCGTSLDENGNCRGFSTVGDSNQHQLAGSIRNRLSYLGCLWLSSAGYH